MAAADGRTHGPGEILQEDQPVGQIVRLLGAHAALGGRHIHDQLSGGEERRPEGGVLGPGDGTVEGDQALQFAVHVHHILTVDDGQRPGDVLLSQRQRRADGERAHLAGGLFGGQLPELLGSLAVERHAGRRLLTGLGSEAVQAQEVAHGRQRAEPRRIGLEDHLREGSAVEQGREVDLVVGQVDGRWRRPVGLAEAVAAVGHREGAVAGGRELDPFGLAILRLQVGDEVVGRIFLLAPGL